jgi:transmembrane sensor
MANTLLSSDQARIDDEASAWVVRLSERALSSEEQRELDSWRASDPRHEETFAALQRTWDEIPELTSLAALVRFELMPPARQDRRSSPQRRRFALAALGAAAAAVVALALLPPLGAPAPRYSTQVAQSRIIALPDGSQVTLGPGSSLDVRFSARERRVRLAGEAFFEIVHGAARPFVVEAGSAIVRDVGTKFDVNATPDTVRVAVLEGAVQVSAPGLKPAAVQQGPHLVRAGQHLEVALSPLLSSRGGESPLANGASAGAAPPGAWREGRLSYDDARLGDVVADLNRYYAPGITLDTAGLGDLRVTASFKASEIPAFAVSLDRVIPVAVVRSADGKVRVSARGT